MHFITNNSNFMYELNVLNNNNEDSFCCTPANFAAFITKGRFKRPPHIQLISKYLMKMMFGKFSKLIVNIPPRHGKSELISKYFTAWFLCHFPDKRVIFTSYNANFAKLWGMKTLEIIKQVGNLYGIEIDKNMRAASDFKIAGRNGGMSAVGAGGSITGKGCDLLIIDDPVKNQSEANSQVIRDKVWDWFLSTAFTRLEPNGMVVIIMTRWHEDDLCGRILNKKNAELPNDWTSLIIPAISEENDILGRKINEPLWANRFNFAKLTEIKNTIGAYWFSALYQQRPSQKEGSIFNRKDFRYFAMENNIIRFRHYNENKLYNLSDCSIYASIDLAVSSKQTSDYTVVIVFAVSPFKEIFILDVIRERFEGAEHVEMVKNVYSKWKPILIGIEKVQYQLTLIQQSLRIGLPVMELIPDADKVSRSLAIANRMRSSMVYFKENAVWLSDFEDELLSFPFGRYKDQTDAFSYIARMIEPHSNIIPIGNKIIRSSSLLNGY